MPTFKVTLHIQDGLTLGHVLMTKGVELIHIIESPDIPKVFEKKQDESKLLTHGKTRELLTRFTHPSGKTTTEFIKDFLADEPENTATWGKMGGYLVKLGYSKSTVNNAVTRLMEIGILEKKKAGVYGLIKKK